MNFEFSEEQLMLKQTMRKFSKEVLEPMLEEQKDKPFTKEFLLSVMKKVKPYGLLGTTVPKELGGDGLDVMTYALIYEELPHELKGILGVSSGLARAIASSDSEYAKKKFLPGLLSGEKTGCSANTEPNVGSDQAQIQTTAYLDGDHYVINGTKTFITNGVHADYIGVSVQFDRSKGKEGVGTILVDRSETPVEYRQIKLMGFEGGDLAELYFDNVRVPKENVIMPEGQGHKRKMVGFHVWRCFVAIHAVSIAEKALEYSLQYVKERHQFGKPIGAFQLIQEMLADMKTEIDAGRLLAYRALDMVTKGKYSRLESSMAKQYATEMAVRVTSKAIQIHGAYGLTSEFPLERLFRSARILTIPEGTTQIQKLIMGRELTGLNALR